MKAFHSKTAIALGTACIAAVWIFLGLFKYKVWDKNGPASGMFPVLIALVLLLCSVIAIVQSFREEKAVYDKQALLVLAGFIFILVANWLVGLLGALLLFFVGWLVWVEKLSWKTIVVATAVVFTVVYATFKVWLMVPFPVGILLEWIKG